MRTNKNGTGLQRAMAAIAVLGGAMLMTTASTATAVVSTTGDGVTTYTGDGVKVWRLGKDVQKLEGTPAAFKDFVHHRLNVLYTQAGKDPDCAHSPLVMVKRYHPDGYAQVTDEGVFPHAGDPEKCAQGGHMAIFAKWKGQWREILGSQEPYQCSDLRHYDVPKSIGGPTCYTKKGKLVDYQP